MNYKSKSTKYNKMNVSRANMEGKMAIVKSETVSFVTKLSAQVYVSALSK